LRDHTELKSRKKGWKHKIAAQFLKHNLTAAKLCFKSQRATAPCERGLLTAIFPGSVGAVVGGYATLRMTVTTVFALRSLRASQTRDRS
jgi:hypothetical protein